MEYQPLTDEASAPRQYMRTNTDKDAARSMDLIRASDVVMSPIDWLWRNWLALGKLHVLAGAPGAGKTTLAMQLAATVTTGGRWPDGSAVYKPGNVIIWSGEDDREDVLKPRLVAAGADCEKVYFAADVIEGDKKRAFDPSKDIDVLKATIRKAGGAAMIIVDPIVNAISGDGHKNGDVRRGLAPLVELATELRCALVGISHLTKGTAGRDPVERITGSLAFGALARIVIMAAKHQSEDSEDPAQRIFVRAKSNIGPDDGGFVYGLEQIELTDHPGIHASYAKWGKMLDGSARDLLAEADAVPDDDASTSLTAAKGFLSEFLSDKPIKATDVQAAALASAISVATLRRAKRDLQVRSTKAHDGSWLWSVDSPKNRQGAQGAQGAHQKPLGTFVNTLDNVLKNDASDDFVEEAV